MTTYNLIIIGGGAAGLMAAGTAAEQGLSVLLLEKMEKPARKLRITGKGRCNITNVKSHDTFLAQIYPDKRFVNPSLRNFTSNQTITFFNQLGVKTIIERGDRVFPASGRAWDVANALENWAKKEGATIWCKSKVENMLVSNSKVVSVDVDIEGNKETLYADSFLIATGGMSYPLTGSTGDGYDFAKQAGHTITNLYPSLVPLTIKDYDTRLNKLKLKNISLSLWIDGGCVASEFGEMEFNQTGITGPVCLRLSRSAVNAILQEKKVEICLDLKPALSIKQLKNRISRELEKTQSCEAILRTLLPQQIINTFAEKANINTNKQVSPSDIEKIISTLKSCRWEISGFASFNEAIITAGGVDLPEIDFKTLQSKKTSNLYFAGEILNIDANTGGYNLQIAFSTARLAAQNIVKFINKNQS